jgi:hypothetical protein
MTEQEYAIIVAIGDALRANPMSWDQIPSDMKETVIAIMRPAPAFTPEQRDFLSRWWLQVSDEQLNAINATMPPNTVCSPRIDGEGNKWLCCDLFTDAVEEGGRLANTLPLLLGLQLHYLPAEYWPFESEE